MTGKQKARALRKYFRKMNDAMYEGYEMGMLMSGGECSREVGESYENWMNDIIESCLEKIKMTLENYIWYLRQFIKIESEHLNPTPYGDCPAAYYDLLIVGNYMENN